MLVIHNVFLNNTYEHTYFNKQNRLKKIEIQMRKQLKSVFLDITPDFHDILKILTCFVQVRKKEPPHPIRIAKTIDVIARITFPTAYAIFLIFFFVHYKGFS
ncbi:hypothetical protein FF38_13885 [Lucilia cuprina]|uniref:Uncharacterized protein n=1 Tax=Lucilia cuprina TaxID=7375 RepID=A0A0L0CJS8_LUCCU|nr:hypothetical protein FF38_13885 [Lucilia cuprina]